jgi:hypothetical protein
MRRNLGWALQLLVLLLMPLIIVFQLFYGMRLILMPILTIAGIVAFLTGQALRSK